jgi:hypothetical protein
MKIERFAGHHEAREALVLSVASVTAIMLTAYLLLLILYCLAQTAKPSAVHARVFGQGASGDGGKADRGAGAGGVCYREVIAGLGGIGR